MKLSTLLVVGALVVGGLFVARNAGAWMNQLHKKKGEITTALRKGLESEKAHAAAELKKRLDREEAAARAGLRKRLARERARAAAARRAAGSELPSTPPRVNQPAKATSGAHFVSATGSLADNQALQVSWDEAGVGSATANYKLGAQSSVTYACISGGGDYPEAANSQSVNGPLASPSTGSNPVDGQMHVANGISVGPLPSNLQCPSGQTFVVACVSYTSITLTDLANNVSTSIADVSRTFVSVAGC